jgi:hypothetical protein
MYQKQLPYIILSAFLFIKPGHTSLSAPVFHSGNNALDTFYFDMKSPSVHLTSHLPYNSELCHRYKSGIYNSVVTKIVAESLPAGCKNWCFISEHDVPCHPFTDDTIGKRITGVSWLLRSEPQTQ